jgi:hypothetical protein
MPKMTTEKWEELSEEFKKYADLPNCVGAIDGKHIRIVQPSDTGSLYYNYKKYFSTVLLAVCDANYCFIFVDIGGYEKSCDSTAFQESLLYKKLIESSLRIPNPNPLSDVSLTPLPYVFVGDDVFGISEHIVRPYSGKSLTHANKILNDLLSRARRFIECAFRITAKKWRIFQRPINVNIEFAECIIRACCVLHNFVRLKDGYNYEDILYEAPLTSIAKGHVPRGSISAKTVRDKYTHYFLN